MVSLHRVYIMATVLFDFRSKWRYDGLFHCKVERVPSMISRCPRVLKNCALISHLFAHKDTSSTCVLITLSLSEEIKNVYQNIWRLLYQFVLPPRQIWHLQ